MADEFGIARHQFRLDEVEIAVFRVLGELFALYCLLKDINQMYRVGGDFLGVMIESCRQDLEGKPRADTGHAFVDTADLTILLNRFCLGIGVFQALAVIDPHFRIKRRVFMVLEARQNAKTA